ncbi:RidA family protein [Curtobacterium sp. NPDC090217]|uniref:RidA family protein n=1 Tax=Curtobacterium sp. NPDC090217 TaxID=3363970 RepID=UPI00380716D7
MTVELSHPDQLLRQDDYAPLAVTTGSRLLLLAGQTASALDGTLTASDLAGQVEGSLRNVAIGLGGGGATLRDVARLTCYVVDWELSKWEAVLEGVSRVQNTDELADPMPPITIIGVQALFRPEILVEIEATAVVD